MLFEQGTGHFHLALEPTGYIASLVCKTWPILSLPPAPMSYLTIIFLFSPDHFDILYSPTKAGSMNNFSHLIIKSCFTNLKSEVFKIAAHL